MAESKPKPYSLVVSPVVYYLLSILIPGVLDMECTLILMAITYIFKMFSFFAEFLKREEGGEREVGL